jgi:flavodoxin
MRYAVLYDSETGNTKEVAKRIYESIDSTDKRFIRIESENTMVPEADIYLVGFPIHQQTCSMKIVDVLEQIETGKIVLFATCGMRPTEKYQQKLEDSLMIWLSDDVEYLGMFLCQGKTTEEQKQVFYRANPEYREKLRTMLSEGDRHPDQQDIKDAVTYISTTLQYAL